MHGCRILNPTYRFSFSVDGTPSNSHTPTRNFSGFYLLKISSYNPDLEFTFAGFYLKVEQRGFKLDL